MKFGYALFARFGLFTQKPDASNDLFDTRLERTRSREARREALPLLFRTRLSHLEA
ncbi:hypothetical protein [Cypionkella sp.]|uniref:hypothetical protein n=1 Tax=Cypionkella sp. TaxID=2811411 RepID=UPI0026378522|nr:hypothetical protein [Cypionkella sp.]MDB5663494.1 hypothetical protein [Cypionkella sp.]